MEDTFATIKESLPEEVTCHNHHPLYLHHHCLQNCNLLRSSFVPRTMLAAMHFGNVILKITVLLIL